MQINPLPGVRFMETFFWNSPWPAESLKTIKPFDGILFGFGHFGSQIDSTVSIRGQVDQFCKHHVKGGKQSQFSFLPSLFFPFSVLLFSSFPTLTFPFRPLPLFSQLEDPGERPPHQRGLSSGANCSRSAEWHCGHKQWIFYKMLCRKPHLFIRAFIHTYLYVQQPPTQTWAIFRSTPAILKGATSFLDRGSYECDQIRVSLCSLCFVVYWVVLSCVIFCVVWFCLLVPWLAGKTYSRDIFCVEGFHLQRPDW